MNTDDVLNMADAEALVTEHAPQVRALLRALPAELRNLRAEVAALRKKLDTMTHVTLRSCADERDAARRELTEACALLTEGLRLHSAAPAEDQKPGTYYARVYAFLRRDEARWEPSDNVFTHDEARDEARRCSCPAILGGGEPGHLPGCPARDDPP